MRSSTSLTLLCVAITVVKTLAAAGATTAAKKLPLLVMPYAYGPNSHFRAMEQLTDLLLTGGYQVTLLSNPSATVSPALAAKVDVWEHDEPRQWQRLMKGTGDYVRKQDLRELLNNFQHMEQNRCKNLLGNTPLMQKLKSSSFALFLVDAVDLCGRVVSDYLQIPTMIFTATGFGTSTDYYPMSPSLIPFTQTSLTDHMDFWQRLRNFAYYASSVPIFHYYMYKPFDKFKEKYGFNTSLSVTSSWHRAHTLHVINSDDVTDYPRPRMPSAIMIGGLFCRPATALQGKFAEFIAAADTGFIVVSFGHFFGSLPGQTESLAAAFSQLDMKVIWRLDTEQQIRIGANTLAAKWIPQNDLLGHPNVKLFVTHAGANSMYEAMYHGVPVVAIPQGVDQPTNANRLTARLEMGVTLNKDNLTERNVLEALNAVLANPQYKLNANAAARLLTDRPMQPNDTFLFYVGYMIRHNGAALMKSPLLVKFSTVQLYSFDIIIFIAVALVLSPLVVMYWLCHVYRLCFKAAPRHKIKDDGHFKPD